MKVNEIFLSLQGEGKNSGKLTTFIRFHGCNLNCSYCDTLLDDYDYKIMQTYEIMSEVNELDCKRICITGGEPLMQDNLDLLLKDLYKKGVEISIETNGTLNITDEIRSYANITMDIKCPSAGVKSGYTDMNLIRLTGNDEIKFVVGTEDDYEFMLT